MRTKGAGPFSHLRLKARVCKRSAQKSRRSRAAVWLWLCSTSALRRAAFDGAAAGGSGRSLRVGLALQSTPALPKAVDCERKTISKKPAVEDGGHCDNPVGERSFESLFGVSAVVRKAGPSEETAVRRPSAPWAGVNSLGRSLPDLCRGSFSGDVPAAEDPEKQRRRAAGRRGLAEATFQRPTCRSKEKSACAQRTLRLRLGAGTQAAGGGPGCLSEPCSRANGRTFQRRAPPRHVRTRAPAKRKRAALRQEASPEQRRSFGRAGRRRARRGTCLIELERPGERKKQGRLA